MTLTHVSLHPTESTQRISHHTLRKVSVSESNVLLDEEVLTDPKIQALLLTVLVRPLAQLSSSTSVFLSLSLLNAFSHSSSSLVCAYF